MVDVLNSTPGVIINIVGAVLMVLFGILVLAVRPKRRANQAFFALAVGFGGWTAIFNLFIRQPGQLAIISWYAAIPLEAASIAGALALAYWYPHRMSRDEFRAMWLATVAASVVLAYNSIFSALHRQTIAAAWGNPPATQSAFGWFAILGWDMFPAFAYFTLIMALRYRYALQRGRRMNDLPIVGFALAPYTAMAVAAFLLVPDDGLVWGRWATLGLLVWASIVILVTNDRPTITMRRTMAWTILASGLFGLAVSVWLGGVSSTINTGLFGFARAIGVALIAFAIVRHQVFGIDVKVRRGISRGTIAALFIAVFFVASESTAQAFSGTKAGPFVGILVAGVLVFFLAPLQRWAERFAAAATGDAKPHPQQTPDERRATYRATAIAAWSDGTIDRSERALLDKLRTDLGLDKATASDIETEASAMTGAA